jgi:hypothetical protein
MECHLGWIPCLAAQNRTIGNKGINNHRAAKLKSYIFLIKLWEWNMFNCPLLSHEYMYEPHILVRGKLKLSDTGISSFITQTCINSVETKHKADLSSLGKHYVVIQSHIYLFSSYRAPKWSVIIPIKPSGQTGKWFKSFSTLILGDFRNTSNKGCVLCRLIVA